MCSPFEELIHWRVSRFIWHCAIPNTSKKTQPPCKNVISARIRQRATSSNIFTLSNRFLYAALVPTDCCILGIGPSVEANRLNLCVRSLTLIFCSFSATLFYSLHKATFNKKKQSNKPEIRIHVKACQKNTRHVLRISTSACKN